MFKKLKWRDKNLIRSVNAYLHNGLNEHGHTLIYTQK